LVRFEPASHNILSPKPIRRNYNMGIADAIAAILAISHGQASEYLADVVGILSGL
jgi:hypothetical protein